jgi:hypothetical protein
MPKKLTAFPKMLHAGRTVRLAGKIWTVQEAYSQRNHGSDKIYRTLLLVLTE